MNSVLSYFITQPREIGLKRRLTFSREEMFSIARNMGFKSSVYVSLYHFSKFTNFKPEYSSALIDKVFFDIDNSNNNAYENMVKFHEYFLKNNITHFVIFSGEGFHVYAITDFQNSFVDKSRALKNYQVKVCQDLGLSWKNIIINGNIMKPDVDGTTIFGDLARIVRLPNTFNPKRGRFCFVLNKELIDNYEQILYESMPQHFNPRKHQGTIFNSQPVSLKPYDVEFKEEKIKYKLESNDNIDVGEIEDEEIGWCHHIAMMLKQKSNWTARFTACLWLRDNGFTEFQVNEILKKYLTQFKRDEKHRPGRNDYEHSILHDKILSSIFSQSGDKYLFPNPQTLIEMGLVSGVCDICSDVYLHRKIT